jgi:hypothetical protein
MFMLFTFELHLRVCLAWVSIMLIVSYIHIYLVSLITQMHMYLELVLYINNTINEWFRSIFIVPWDYLNVKGGR